MQALIRPTRRLVIAMHPTEVPRGTDTEFGSFLKKIADNSDIYAENYLISRHILVSSGTGDRRQSINPQGSASGNQS
jgi:hypothetical protein